MYGRTVFPRKIEDKLASSNTHFQGKLASDVNNRTTDRRTIIRSTIEDKPIERRDWLTISSRAAAIFSRLCNFPLLSRRVFNQLSYQTVPRFCPYSTIALLELWSCFVFANRVGTQGKFHDTLILGVHCKQCLFK